MTASKFGLASLTALSLILAAGTAQAVNYSPFRAMAGSWTGGGMLSMADGEQQRLRCRAAYDPAGGGEAMRLNIRCASPSYNFDLASEVEDRGGTITGSWSEATRNASGSIEGRAMGEHIEATAQGQNFGASISLTTRGNRQSVVIRPAGTDVRSVSLALERR